MRLHCMQIGQQLGKAGDKAQSAAEQAKNKVGRAVGDVSALPDGPKDAASQAKSGAKQLGRDASQAGKDLTGSGNVVDKVECPCDRLCLMPLAEQRRFIDAIEAVAPGRGFILYTYCITSPLPWKKLGLSVRREAWTPLNLPPASVFRYTPR